MHLMNTVIVIDYGSPHTRLAARLLRDLGQFSRIVSGQTNVQDILRTSPAGIVIGGSANMIGRHAEALVQSGVPYIIVGEDEPTKQDLDAFLTRTDSPRNWTPATMVAYATDIITKTVGDKRVMLGISGGVDSTTLGVLLHRAIGDQLVGVFVDHGMLRYDEANEVSAMLRGLGLQLEVVDASGRFFRALEGISDPEEKRKVIGENFINVFTSAAKQVQETYGPMHFLGQGTLYSDVLESENVGGAVSVKSHHNVGGLPAELGFTLLEPFRELFKDEVRAIATELGIPEELSERHPFPGPGLAIRIIGEVTPAKVVILQHVDYLFIEALKAHDLYNETWQALAVLVPVRSVGVTNNQRTYGYTVVLRAVSSTDAMTATWTRLPYDFLAEISEQITREVREVNRVVFDITNKPPGTIEWE